MDNGLEGSKQMPVTLCLKGLTLLGHHSSIQIRSQGATGGTRHKVATNSRPGCTKTTHSEEQGYEDSLETTLTIRSCDTSRADPSPFRKCIYSE